MAQDNDNTESGTVAETGVPENERAASAVHSAGKTGSQQRTSGTSVDDGRGGSGGTSSASGSSGQTSGGGVDASDDQTAGRGGSDIDSSTEGSGF